MRKEDKILAELEKIDERVYNEQTGTDYGFAYSDRETQKLTARLTLEVLLDIRRMLECLLP